MNNYERDKLDKLFQIEILKYYKNISILGGIATVVHHFIHKSKGDSIRWFVPNGIPLTEEQHQAIHNKSRAELEKQIIRKFGDT